MSPTLGSAASSRSNYHASRTDKDRKTRSHIRQLQALGYTVTLAPAA